MKFMKLGTRPDTFYTEEATRTVMSDVPSDLTIKINNISYLLHKLQYPLLPKSGLLQRLYRETEESSTLHIHDIPGGEEAFEVCAKFCYGITINLSAHNFVSAFCAANFLGMTEAVQTGNFLIKLDAFFSACILQGWKDPILALHNTQNLFHCAQNLGILRRCIESIVDKILTPPSKVTWSYTYTRAGYDEKKRHHRQSVPKDWWTEDISFLNVDMFRCILAAIKSDNTIQPQLIGEALHVYACRWLQPYMTTGKHWPTIINNNDEAEASTSQDDGGGGSDRKRRIHETVVSLIPADRGSVSFRFLLRLLSMAASLAVSPATKSQLLRLAGLQLEEATLNDLLLPVNDQSSYDVQLIQTVLESFLQHWKRQVPADERESMRLMRKIGKLLDSYLQVVAKDPNIPVQRLASLAVTLPGIARPEHDDLYKAINIYLKEHPDLSKAEKKQLCRILDCQKLSPEIRSHAVRNERLPLRTVVQAIFFEHDKANLSKQILSPAYDERGIKGNRSSAASTSGVHEKKSSKPDEKQLQMRAEPSFKVREVREVEMDKRKERELITRISHS
ncbi:Phototropic-responsive NPH3 family protein [Perilla frutescens var. frutescens]|nr:Phototropic-responsive NPH3 family protein [Perilla frutescens var. frutescens]